MWRNPDLKINLKHLKIYFKLREIAKLSLPLLFNIPE